MHVPLMYEVPDGATDDVVELGDRDHPSDMGSENGGVGHFMNDGIGFHAGVLFSRRFVWRKLEADVDPADIDVFNAGVLFSSEARQHSIWQHVHVAGGED